MKPSFSRPQLESLEDRLAPSTAMADQQQHGHKPVHRSDTPTAPAVAQSASLPGSNYLIVAMLLPGSSHLGFPSGGSGVTSPPPPEAFALFQPRTQAQAAVNLGAVEPTSQPAAVELEVRIDAPGSPGWQTFSMGVDQSLNQRRLAEQVLDRIADGIDAIKETVEDIKSRLQPLASALEVTESELRLGATGLDWLADLPAGASTQDNNPLPATVPATASMPLLLDQDSGERDESLDWRVALVVFLLEQGAARVLEDAEELSRQRVLCR
jgi:hypothetical protein